MRGWGLRVGFGVAGGRGEGQDDFLGVFVGAVDGDGIGIDAGWKRASGGAFTAGGVLGVEIFPGGEDITGGFEDGELIQTFAEFARGGISALGGFGFDGDFAQGAAVFPFQGDF